MIFTFGEMLAFSRHQAYAASLASEDMRGRYVGFLSLAWGIGGIFSSNLGLRIYEQGPDTICIISAVLVLVANIMTLGWTSARPTE